MISIETKEDKKTVLFDEHNKLKAKIAPFGGWLMPIQYEGIIKEHNAVRTACGLFDVSHMGQIFVSGADSLNFLEFVTAQVLKEIPKGKAIYCHLTNEKGGVIDDLIIYNSKNIIKDTDYLIIANASRLEEDLNHLNKIKEKFDVEVINASNDFSMLALQGPNSKFVIEKLGVSLANQPKFFSFIETKLNNTPVYLTRTGYTGEDGFEIILENKYIIELWNKILSFNQEFGVVPIGLGARDTLRLEAGLPLFGHELNEETTPIESSLGFFVPKDKETNYIGKTVIMAQKLKQMPLRRKLFAFIMEDRMIARNGYEVFIEGSQVGVVTSGAPSPTLNKNIGFAMIEFKGLDDTTVAKLNNPQESIGFTIQIMVRNKLYNAKIVKKPFVEKRYQK